MRILQICTQFGAGGIARHAVDLGRWLRNRGHTIYFAGAPGENMAPGSDHQFLSLGIDLVSGEGNKVVRAGYALTCALQLRKFLAQNEVDLIHCHESAPAIVARLATIGMDLPITLTYHGSEPERIRGFAYVGKITAKQVITPSHRSAADLIGIGGLDKSKVRVIGLGIRQAPPFDASVADQLRRDLLGKNGKLLVVVVARVCHQKGIDILIRVAERLSQRRQDLRIVVVGGGPLLDEMKVLSKSTGVDHLVQFVGYKENPHLYLHASDLFLLTSRWEALPISIIEALRAGLPVIAADTSGVEELVDSTVGAVLPIGDVEAFAHSILRICGDDELRKELAEAALNRSTEDRFSPDHVHSIFENNYIEMIASAGDKRTKS
jgi:glycosyltransferase involved in cell wall biosynthesis